MLESMKSSRHEQNYRQIAPPAGGMVAQGSNKTKNARSAAMMSLVCDNCGDSYETYACWFKKGGKKNHFCSVECHNEWRKIKIISACEICGKHFFTTPSEWFKKVTCSRKCLKKKRSEFLTREASDIATSSIFNFGNHETGIELGIAKLTIEQVEKIYFDSRPQSSIALDFGISQSNVSSIKLGKTWGHVTSKLTPLAKAKGCAKGTA